MASKGVVRRKHVRQQRTGTSPPLWRRLTEPFGPLPYLLALLFLLGCTVIALYGPPSRKYSVGQIIEQPIYAEVNFEVIDERETLRLKQAARAATPSSYTINNDLILRVESELQKLYQAAQAAESFEAFRPAAEKAEWVVDEAAYAELRSYADDASRFEASITRLKNRLTQEWTWNPESSKERNPEPTSRVVLVYGTEAEGDTEASPRPREVSVFKLTPVSNDTSLRRGADDLAVKSQFAPALRVTVVRAARPESGLGLGHVMSGALCLAALHLMRAGLTPQRIDAEGAELAGIQAVAELQHGGAFLNTAFMSLIDRQGDNATRLDQFQTLLQRLKRGWRLGHDDFVTARQVAEIKHDDADLALQVAQVFQHGFVPGTKKLHAIHQACGIEPPPSLLNRLGLNIKGVDLPGIAHESSQELRVMSVTGGGIDDSITGLDAVSNPIMGDLCSAGNAHFQKRVMVTSSSKGAPVSR